MSNLSGSSGQWSCCGACTPAITLSMNPTVAAHLLYTLSDIAYCTLGQNRRNAQFDRSIVWANMTCPGRALMSALNRGSRGMFWRLGAVLVLRPVAAMNVTRECILPSTCVACWYCSTKRIIDLLFLISSINFHAGSLLASAVRWGAVMDPPAICDVADPLAATYLSHAVFKSEVSPVFVSISCLYNSANSGIPASSSEVRRMFARHSALKLSAAAAC